MHKYPQNQSVVGSSGQTLTTNVSMTLSNWQACHETYVLCGYTTFGTESKLGPKLIRSLRLRLDKGVAITRGGGKSIGTEDRLWQYIFHFEERS